MSKKDWKIRAAQAQDLSFIYQSWLFSYSRNSEIGRSVRNSVFNAQYHHVVDKILKDAATIVACKLNDDLIIYGYLVFEPKVVHYCFVKEAFRFTGIAKDLYKTAIGKYEAGVQFTHLTKEAKAIVEKYRLLTYNPFILFKELGDK
jgi:hypothetical protein